MKDIVEKVNRDQLYAERVLAVVNIDEERKNHHKRLDQTKEERDPIYELCLERVREDPNRSYEPVLEEAIALGYSEGKMHFIRSPWRRAKINERVERTGQRWPNGKPGPRKQEPAPRQEESITVIKRPEGAVAFIDYRTTVGTLTVRPEGDEWRLLYSAKLDRKTVEHLLPLLTAMLQAHVLK